MDESFLRRGGAGVVLHSDYLAGVDDLYLAVGAALGLEAGSDLILDADEGDVHAKFSLRAHSALYYFLRRVIAAHCVNDYPHSGKPPLP